MSHPPSPLLRTLASALLTAGLLAAITPAQALKSFMGTWQATYPGSTTDNANCALCHGTQDQNLNAYGKALCDAFDGNLPLNIVPALEAIESLDSDSDPTASTNLQEINVNAQPGWTEGPVNQIYVADVGGRCVPTGAPISVVAGVPVPYDPPVDGEPVADPSGPYAGYVNVPITFDGSGSYDSDVEGAGIVSYTWNFGDGSPDEVTTDPTVQHTYTLPDTYIVNLTVTDDEGDTNTNSTIATISGASVLDLDIAAFKVTTTRLVGKLIAIKLSVENPGTVLGQAKATVTGTQGGVQVYKWSLNVYDSNITGTTSFTFPSYRSKIAGTIKWVVTIADVNPDQDRATATTTVQ